MVSGEESSIPDGLERPSSLRAGRNEVPVLGDLRIIVDSVDDNTKLVVVASLVVV